jgi:hypothetical protein
VFYVRDEIALLQPEQIANQCRSLESEIVSELGIRRSLVASSKNL